MYTYIYIYIYIIHLTKINAPYTCYVIYIYIDTYIHTYIQAAFHSFDKNKDGVLSRQELAQALESTKLGLTEAQVCYEYIHAYMRT